MKNQYKNELRLDEAGIITNTLQRIQNRLMSGASKFETNKEMKDREEEERMIDKAEAEQEAKNKKEKLKEFAQHYKGILNEMIPNAERFGSRMGLARHQAARVKKVIDAHNADVDAKSFKNQGQPEFPTWHQKDVTDRAKRIQSIAQAHGAVISAQGTPEMRTKSMNYSNGGIIHPSEVKLAQLDSKNKPMSTVDFSILGDANRRIGQDNADKLRTTGLADRRKKAAQAAKDAERQKIKNAFTFESLTQMYANILRETYRITPKRRELLNRVEGEARQSVEDQLSGTTPMNQHDLMMNTSKMARVEAIKQMGLPQDVRTGRGRGLNDRQLKIVMGNARATQKNLEYLKRKEAK